ncbi:uncharacterized protein BDZ99DRAFT_276889 [Mytilinidion resinicola]|uniref:Uncharacterized protein n=1 Tax=Mytilinidion resinicola TaxID=574789 RepID=A0A6A6YRF2_9PEZI|nr:uncharacterized protein BDZ99DRAFT_276889 [Mytilinidion resinicola]KAF2811516.1 hypothetical protein BDZ99DRAFT_276889 [Mytilinidion resinicola]
MPEHLEVLVFSKKAQDMITNLDEWLANNDDYKPVDKNFDECVRNGIGEEVIPLGDEIARGIATIFEGLGFEMEELIGHLPFSMDRGKLRLPDLAFPVVGQSGMRREGDGVDECRFKT